MRKKYFKLKRNDDLMIKLYKIFVLPLIVRFWSNFWGRYNTEVFFSMETRKLHKILYLKQSTMK